MQPKVPAKHLAIVLIHAIWVFMAGCSNPTPSERFEADRVTARAKETTLRAWKDTGSSLGLVSKTSTETAQDAVKTLLKEYFSKQFGDAEFLTAWSAFEAAGKLQSLMRLADILQQLDSSAEEIDQPEFSQRITLVSEALVVSQELATSGISSIFAISAVHIHAAMAPIYMANFAGMSVLAVVGELSKCIEFTAARFHKAQTPLFKGDLKGFEESFKKESNSNEVERSFNEVGDCKIESYREQFKSFNSHVQSSIGDLEFKHRGWIGTHTDGNARFATYGKSAAGDKFTETVSVFILGSLKDGDFLFARSSVSADAELTVLLPQAGQEPIRTVVWAGSLTIKSARKNTWQLDIVMPTMAGAVRYEMKLSPDKESIPSRNIILQGVIER